MSTCKTSITAKVDFELIGGIVVRRAAKVNSLALDQVVLRRRQRVPQDWVLLAATSREIKAGVELMAPRSMLNTAQMQSVAPTSC